MASVTSWAEQDPTARFLEEQAPGSDSAISLGDPGASWWAHDWGQIWTEITSLRWALCFAICLLVDRRPGSGL